MSCLSVTQFNSYVNAEVMYLVYEGPQYNCYLIQIYILDAVMDWLLRNVLVSTHQ